jgi:NitT/TauT family transport system ATP-binding protein
VIAEAESKREGPSSLRCREMSVQFANSRPAVDTVSCEFPAGLVTSLVGPSGCGKTTLLRTLARLQAPTAGSIEVVPPARPERGEVAFVFQQPTLLPWRSAMENVMLPLQLGIDPVAGASIRDRARTELLAMELNADSLERLPTALSGGMRMRVSLARALVTRPSVLLLDEPFAALDDMLRTTLCELLLRRWSERPFTIVLVTHNIGEAAMLSHHVLVMRDGKIGQAFDNEMPWPRTEAVRTSPSFGEFYRRISDALRGRDA